MNNNLEISFDEKTLGKEDSVEICQIFLNIGK